MGRNLDILKQARAELVTKRRQVADGLAKPFDETRTPKLMEIIVGIQSVIDALDRAIEDEAKSEQPV